MANTYSPKRVVVVYNGLILTGFADGTFISADNDSDDFSKHVGADGEVARTANADESGTITLTLLQTSKANDLLNGLREIDKLTHASTGPFAIEDLNGRTLVIGHDTWIQKGPAIEYGKEVVGRVWNFQCAKLKIIVGGNGFQ